MGGGIYLTSRKSNGAVGAITIPVPTASGGTEEAFLGPRIILTRCTISQNKASVRATRPSALPLNRSQYSVCCHAAAQPLT